MTIQNEVNDFASRRLIDLKENNPDMLLTDRINEAFEISKIFNPLAEKNKTAYTKSEKAENIQKALENIEKEYEKTYTEDSYDIRLDYGSGIFAADFEALIKGNDAVVYGEKSLDFVRPDRMSLELGIENKIPFKDLIRGYSDNVCSYIKGVEVPRHIERCDYMDVFDTDYDAAQQWKLETGGKLLENGKDIWISDENLEYFYYPDTPENREALKEYLLTQPLEFNWDNFTEEQFNAVKEEITSGNIKEDYKGQVYVGSVCAEFTITDKDSNWVDYNCYILGEKGEGEIGGIPYSYQNGEQVVMNTFTENTYENFKTVIENVLTEDLGKDSHLKQEAMRKTINWVTINEENKQAAIDLWKEKAGGNMENTFENLSNEETIKYLKNYFNEKKVSISDGLAEEMFYKHLDNGLELKKTKNDLYFYTVDEETGKTEYVSTHKIVDNVLNWNEKELSELHSGTADDKDIESLKGFVSQLETIKTQFHRVFETFPPVDFKISDFTGISNANSKNVNPSTEVKFTQASDMDIKLKVSELGYFIKLDAGWLLQDELIGSYAKEIVKDQDNNYFVIDREAEEGSPDELPKPLDKILLDSLVAEVVDAIKMRKDERIDVTSISFDVGFTNAYESLVNFQEELEKVRVTNLDFNNEVHVQKVKEMLGNDFNVSDEEAKVLLTYATHFDDGTHEYGLSEDGYLHFRTNQDNEGWSFITKDSMNNDFLTSAFDGGAILLDPERTNDISLFKSFLNKNQTLLNDMDNNKWYELSLRDLNSKLEELNEKNKSFIVTNSVTFPCGFTFPSDLNNEAEMDAYRESQIDKIKEKYGCNDNEIESEIFDIDDPENASFNIHFSVPVPEKIRDNPEKVNEWIEGVENFVREECGCTFINWQGGERNETVYDSVKEYETKRTMNTDSLLDSAVEHCITEYLIKNYAETRPGSGKFEYTVENQSYPLDKEELNFITDTNEWGSVDDRLNEIIDRRFDEEIEQKKIDIISDVVEYIAQETNGKIIPKEHEMEDILFSNEMIQIYAPKDEFLAIQPEETKQSLIKAGIERKYLYDNFETETLPVSEKSRNEMLFANSVGKGGLTQKAFAENGIEIDIETANVLENCFSQIEAITKYTADGHDLFNNGNGVDTISEHSIEYSEEAKSWFIHEKNWLALSAIKGNNAEPDDYMIKADRVGDRNWALSCEELVRYVYKEIKEDGEIEKESPDMFQKLENLKDYTEALTLKNIKVTKENFRSVFNEIIKLPKYKDRPLEAAGWCFARVPKKNREEVGKWLASLNGSKKTDINNLFNKWNMENNPKPNINKSKSKETDEWSISD